jgi:hypothetical protein
MQATDYSGSRVGVGGCPRGKIDGLTYGPDNGGPFRSTGDIAGPCGVEYSGL